MTETLLKLVEVLELLKVSRKTFYTMRRTGSFPRPILVGKRERWNKDQIIEWSRSANE